SSPAAAPRFRLPHLRRDHHAAVIPLAKVHHAGAPPLAIRLGPQTPPTSASPSHSASPAAGNDPACGCGSKHHRGSPCDRRAFRGIPRLLNFVLLRFEAHTRWYVIWQSVI